MTSEEPVHLVHLDDKAPDPQAPRARRKEKTSRPQRYRYWRRHTPHYYLVLAGVSSAVATTVIDAIAYRSKAIYPAEIAFGATCVTGLLISIAFFWGFYLLMNWRIPYGRIAYFIPHGIVGTLSPLLYALNISLQFNVLGQPLPGWALVLNLITLALIGVQFTMGKIVVHVPPLQIVRSDA